jgi:8-oxo-dGTP pyrophosphatase MutT (NUDIX family)
MRAHEFTEPRAAGCIIVAKDTGRWCLQQRSDQVSDPGVWSTWGGGREPGETLEQTVRRELAEEGGYVGPLKLEPLSSNGQYATFIGRVPHEFEPQINKESKDWCWCEADQLPEPLHPGLVQALNESSLKEAINPDIRNKNFKHTQVIGDYTYTASVEIFLGEPLLNIKAYHGNKEIGHVLFEIYGTKINGYLESGGTEVDPKYRNKGVASTMYAYAKMLGNDIKPSYNRTDQGKAMWAAWNKSGDTRHLTGDVAENFDDGKNPGRKGLSRRVGIPKKPSLGQLEKIAKSSTGERRRMAQWQLNMRRGKAKKNK